MLFFGELRSSTIASELRTGPSGAALGSRRRLPRSTMAASLPIKFSVLVVCVSCCGLSPRGPDTRVVGPDSMMLQRRCPQDNTTSGKRSSSSTSRSQNLAPRLDEAVPPYHFLPPPTLPPALVYSPALLVGCLEEGHRSVPAVTQPCSGMATMFALASLARCFHLAR